MKKIKHIFAFILAFSIMLEAFGVKSITPSSADELKKYTVKFDSNDGHGVFYKTKKLSNVGIITPDINKSYEGFLFMGWAYKKNATNPDIGSFEYYEENKSRTLYAVWRIADRLEFSYKKPNRAIDVKNIVLKAKTSKKLDVKVPGEGKAKISFKSSNKRIARVSSSGKVTGLKKGKAKITITTKEDGLYAKTKKTIIVKVK